MDINKDKISILREPLEIVEGFTGYANCHVSAKHISTINKKDSFKFMDALSRLLQAKAIGDEIQIKEQSAILDGLEISKAEERGKGFDEPAAMGNFWFYWRLHTGNRFLRINHFFPIYSNRYEKKEEIKETV